MITITKIQGESYDVNTGQEMGRALVITNGISTATIEVPDAAVETVVQLIVELQQRHQHPVREEYVTDASGGNPVIKEGASRAVPSKANGSRVRSPMREALPSQARDFFESALSGDVNEENFEPGETYDDPDTGVSSL